MSTTELNQPSVKSSLNEEPRTKDLTLKKLGWTPLVMIVILSIFTLISFILGYRNGNLNIYLPFISETGALGPNMCTFSLGIYFGSTAGALAVFFRYLILTYYFNGRKKMEIINFVALLLGVISFAGLGGVGAYPVSTILPIHLVAAGIHFGLGVVYTGMQTFLTYQMPQEYKVLWLCRLRLALSTLIFITLIPLIILFPWSYFNWIKIHDHPPALKVPEDKLFGAVFASSFLEWSMYGLFLFYFFTLIYELRNFYLELRVIPVFMKR